MSTIASSKPIYTAVLLDLDTAEALQQQLYVPLLSHDDDDDDDAYALSSSSSTRTVTTVKVLNFLTGICIGVIFSCLGFRVLLEQWQTMSQTDVMLFSVIWSSVTSVSAYLLFNALYAATRCFIGSNNESSDYMESTRTTSLLEYCYAVGVFLGFCGACTWTDVVYGMPAKSIFLTIVVAAMWAYLMIYCALKTSPSEQEEEEERAQRRRHRGTILPMVFV
jgi:hypothetical protein